MPVRAHRRIAEAITANFGSFDEFKAKFEAAGLARFGSGWAWLVLNRQAARNRLHGESGHPPHG